MATILPLHADFRQNTSDQKITPIDPVPAIWIYGSTTNTITQRGVWAMTSLTDMDEGRIIAHENVLPEKIERIIAHRNSGGKPSSPVLLTYRPDAELDQLIQQICLDENSAYLHRTEPTFSLWRIGEPELIDRIQMAFRTIKAVYVADGHHRLAAAHKMQQQHERLISSLYVPSDQLKISAFHRLVRMNNPVNHTVFMDQISEYYVVRPLKSEKPYRPDRPNRIGLYFQGCWYRLDLRDNARKEGRPDASSLQELILAPLLGIADPASDERLENFPDPAFDEMVSALQAGEGLVGFTLYPMTVSEFLVAADSQEMLPPKSTWIEPKIPRKLLIQAGI